MPRPRGLRFERHVRCDPRDDYCSYYLIMLFQMKTYIDTDLYKNIL